MFTNLLLLIRIHAGGENLYSCLRLVCQVLPYKYMVPFIYGDLLELQDDLG